MLKNCRISGFADEINRDFDVQMAVLKDRNTWSFEAPMEPA